MPNDQPAFLSQPGAVNPMGGDTKQGPHQDPEFMQGGASAGRFFSNSELPVQANQGGMPSNLNGFRPSAENPPLPTPGTSEGSGKFPDAC